MSIRDYKTNTSRNQQTEYQIYSKKKRSRRVMVSVILLTILSILFLIAGQKSKPELVYTRYGRLADQFIGPGLFVRLEEVVYAPFAGQVRYLVGDGERVASGIPILELAGTGDKKTFYSDEPGVVSFQLDGLENTLNLKSIKDIQQNYRSYRGKAMLIKNGERVNAGRPLFRIVDNSRLYVLVEVPDDQIYRYERGEKVWTTVGAEEIIGWIRKIVEYQNLFVIELERFPHSLLTIRRQNVAVLTNAFVGVYVPRKAVVKKDGVYGVYRLYKEDAIFHELKLRGGNDTDVVVTGIHRGIEILANPLQDLPKFTQEDE